MTFPCFDRHDVPHLHLSDVPPRLSPSNCLPSSSCDVRLPHRGVVGMGTRLSPLVPGWVGLSMVSFSTPTHAPFPSYLPWFHCLPPNHAMGTTAMHGSPWVGSVPDPKRVVGDPSPSPPLPSGCPRTSPTPSCGSSSVPSGTQQVDPMGSGLSRKNLQWIRSWERRAASMDPTPARVEGRRHRGPERASNERAAAISNTWERNNAKGNATERK